MKEKILKIAEIAEEETNLFKEAFLFDPEATSISFNQLVKIIDRYVNQEVEKRIAERQLTDEEIEKNFTTPHYHYEKGHYYKVRKDRIFGAKWYRSRLTQPNNSEGGEG